jgi:hypothetical protein
MKKFVLAALVTVAFGAVDAFAQGCQGPGCQGGGYAGYPQVNHFNHPFFRGVGPFANHPSKGHPLFAKDKLAIQPTLPVYMAAPWYLYWPYDGHFQTIAPMAAGQFYPPPAVNVPQNPFMPAAYQGYVPNAGVPYIR